MTESDTPRTDSVEPQIRLSRGGWVRADFARGLEREIAALYRKLDRIMRLTRDEEPQHAIKQI